MSIGAATACVRLSCEAIATRYELVLRGDDPGKVHAAGEEALKEIERLDWLLNVRRRDSELSRINAGASRSPVVVAPQLYRLLERCLQIAEATDGAFDITNRWFAKARPAHAPCPVHLDPRRFAISFTRPGVAIDLGSAARGYALDRAVRVLAENEVTDALVYAGSSSIHAIGDDEGTQGWTVRWSPRDAPSERLSLRDEALSVSTGGATASAAAALVVGPNSFECEALSAALLVLGRGRASAMAQQFPGYHAHLA